VGLPRPADRAPDREEVRPRGQQAQREGFRAACRKFAQEQVELQRADFKRFGVLGDWNNPVSHHGSALRGAAGASLGK
jgi:isoleucyl-tRNA synthetase